MSTECRKQDSRTPNPRVKILLQLNPLTPILSRKKKEKRKEISFWNSMSKTARKLPTTAGFPSVWRFMQEALRGPLCSRPVLQGGSMHSVRGGIILCCEQGERGCMGGERRCFPLAIPAIIILTGFYLHKSVMREEMACPGSSTLVLYHPLTLTPRWPGGKPLFGVPPFIPSP